MIRPLWICVLAGAAALAQNGTIEGTVVDSATQGPVRKAQIVVVYRGPLPGTTPAAGNGTGPVFMSGRRMIGGGTVGGLHELGSASFQPATAVTDESGSFVFRNIAPGLYSVQAMHPRYPIKPVNAAGTQVTLKPGETTRMSIPLTPGASITGRVLDEDGEPLPGCSVQLRSATSRQPGVVSMGGEASNDQGAYRIYGLHAGRYIAFAACGRPAFQPRPFSSGPPPQPTTGYPAVYYPQASDASAATPIEVAAGTELSGIDFQMRPARVYTVTGTVSGFDRQAPQQQNRMILVNLNQAKQAATMSRGARVNPETGAFELPNVFPGSYIVTATQLSPDPNAGMMAARQQVEVTDQPTHVNLVLQKPLDIRGTFTIEGNREVAKEHLGVSVIPADDEVTPMSRPRPDVDRDGTFVLRSTPPGRWLLFAYGSDVYTRAVEADGQTLPNNVLDTTTGTVGSLRIVVSTRTATAQGRGTPGTVYSLVRDDSDPRLMRPYSGVADPNGAVRISGVPPGSYGVYRGPLQDETQRIDTVSLSEEATAEVDFTKQPGR